MEPADHIHLPQLHRPGPLPPPIIGPFPPSRPRLHQAVADQRPIDAGSARHWDDPVLGQLVADPVRPPKLGEPAGRPRTPQPRPSGSSDADTNAASRNDHPTRPDRRRRYTAAARCARSAATPRTGGPPRSPRRPPAPPTPPDTAAQPSAAPEASRAPSVVLRPRKDPPPHTATGVEPKEVSSTYRNDCRPGTGTASPI